MNLPNYITFIRFFTSPLFVLLYISHDFFGISTVVLPYVLLILLIISGLSDIFDGYLARRYNQVTDLGKILDPMVDSIVNLSVFLTFTMAPIYLPVPLIFLFIYRNSLVSTLRTVCALRGFALAARKSGKIKTFIQTLTAYVVLLLMIPHSLGYLSTENLQFISAWIVGLAGAYTLYSGFDYIYANHHYIRKLLSSNNSSKTE